MAEIQRADPDARRRAIVVITVATVVGGIAIFAGERCWPVVADWLSSDPGRFRLRLATITTLAVALTAVPLLGFAAYAWSLGTRVRHQQRFPLEGVRLVRDTPVVSGAAAAARGRFMQVLAVLLAALAACVAALWWRFAVLVSGIVR
jgi:hypothetical protein